MTGVQPCALPIYWKLPVLSAGEVSGIPSVAVKCVDIRSLHRHELSSHYEAILLAAAFLTTATYSEAEKALLALWRKAGMLEGA